MFMADGKTKEGHLANPSIKLRMNKQGGIMKPLPQTIRNKGSVDGSVGRAAGPSAGNLVSYLKGLGSIPDHS